MPEPDDADVLTIVRKHWPLYLMEGAELAAFMIAACVMTALLFRTGSALGPWPARGLMGLAMGATAIAIINSPWGKRSGAQFNPAITLTFYRLGKIGGVDAIGYVVGQFVGGLAGVGLAALLLGARIRDPHVNYAVTVPGVGGVAAAFAAETFMAAVLLFVVLYTSNRPLLAPWTTWLVGLLIANYIVFLAPVSGFSINPARTLGSAVFAHDYRSLWIYFTAPVLGMMMAAAFYCRMFESGPQRYFFHRHLVQPDRQV